MCGRFALTVTPEDVLEFLSLAFVEEFPPRYNIAPTQPLLVVIEDEGAGEPGSNLPKRRAMLARWGLIPSWVKDPRDFPLLVNARSETAASKASFCAAMRHRRILVPASGFYEWHRPPKESGKKSQAYWVRPTSGKLVAFAGLMETWSSADGSEIDTAAILTTSANPSFAPIHDRMPVVIPPEEFSRWLDCKTQEPREVEDRLVPPPEDMFEVIPVSDLVNKVANTGPDVQNRIDPAEVVQEIKPKNKKAAGNKSGGGQMSLF